MKVKGNLEITKKNYKEYKDLESVGGDLSISSQAKLDNLKSVGGDLSIYSQAKLEAKNLKSVGGYLSIYSQAKLDNLKSVGGSLSISSQAKLDSLKSVGGYLSISSQAKLEAKNLKSVGGSLSISSQAKLEAKNLKSVGGYLSIYSQAKLDSLKSVGGDLYISSPISRPINELISRILKSRKRRNLYINNVKFKESLFNKVRLDKLSASQVFSLENIEQRRVAYEIMDKTKMKKLKGYKVLDKKKDKYNNLMEIVSFKISGFKKRFLYLHCICPSTKREYFLETQSRKCHLAKARSFGLKKVNFKEEY